VEPQSSRILLNFPFFDFRNCFGASLKELGFDLELQQQFILLNDCWGFLNGIVACFLVLYFRRRTSFLVSTAGMFFILATIVIYSVEGVLDSETAPKVMIFLVFLFSPFYNLAFNALTYSKCLFFIR
jgi:hypothetical protein